MREIGSFRPLLFVGAMCLCLVSPGCSDGSGGGSAAPDSRGSAGSAGSRSQMEEWRLSEAPVLDIGVQEGAEPYQLHRASGSALLEDGRVVVLNSGSDEVRFFDSKGVFLSSVGQNGEGPGEFRSPSRLRRGPGGSLFVWDDWLQRVSLFSPDGEFLESYPLLPRQGALFPGDEWIYGRNWVVSPIPPDARGPLQRALDAMPPADSTTGLRFVLLTTQGRIWTAPVRPPADSALTWNVFDLQGRRLASLVTPPRFEPHEVGPDYVIGRRLGDFDVNHIQLFELVKPAGGDPGPGLASFSSGPSGMERPTAPMGQDPAKDPPSEEILVQVRSLLKNLATLEEIHYSQHMTYTRDAEVLFSEARSSPPKELKVDILFASTDGWISMVTHEETGDRCVLAYGAFVPMGWASGTVLCP